jgi:hypothetical protein
MVRHKLLNKTKSVTVTEPKHFHLLNKPEDEIKKNGCNKADLSFALSKLLKCLFVVFFFI